MSTPLFPRISAVVVLSIGGIVGSVALYGGLRAPAIVKHRLTLSRLPQKLSGMRLVLLADVHLGPISNKARMQRIVDDVNAQNPDAVLILGDLVDGSVALLGDAAKELTRLSSRYGTFFVTGNHEYYSGAPEWIEELTRLGVRVLCNERVTLGDADASIDLAGINDVSSNRFAHHVDNHSHRYVGSDLDKALEGYDPRQELILMSHQPRVAEIAHASHVGLLLSGHTHGGQIWPFGYLVALTQPYLAGLGSLGDMQIYVNVGTGFWGPPMRLGTRAEITVLTLLSPNEEKHSSSGS